MIKIDDSIVKLCDCVPNVIQVGTLCAEIDNNVYEGAHHQRPPRWDPWMYPSLIWTIVRGFPLAPIHVCEHPRGEKCRTGVRVRQVNDGGHRVRGIYAYRNNKFAIEVRDPITDVVVERVYYDAVPTEQTARREFTATMQLEVLQRQGNTCAMAGCSNMGREMDHIKPLWKGGEHSTGNAQWVCCDCHKQKSASEAAERARTQVGSSLDRIMTDDEREGFDNFTVPIVTYKNYRDGVPHEEIQRLIFRQVQNGVRMDGNDQLFAEGDPVLLHFIEERLLVKSTGIRGLANVVKGTHISREDFWQIEKSGCNIYQIVEALFRGTFEGKYQGDTWIPGPTHKFTGRGRIQHFEGLTRDRHLRPFEKTLCSANRVVSTCLPGVHLDFEDYAIVMHCCHGYSEFEAFATGVDGPVLGLASMIDAWEDTRSMKPKVILEKMHPLLKAMKAARDPVDSPPGPSDTLVDPADPRAPPDPLAPGSPQTQRDSQASESSESRAADGDGDESRDASEPRAKRVRLSGSSSTDES